MTQVNLFETNEQINALKKRSFYIAIFSWVISIIGFILLFVLHDRNHSIICSIVGGIILSVPTFITITIIINLINPLNAYLKLLNRTTNNLQIKENLSILKLDDQIFTKNNLSFKKIIFLDSNKDEIAFYYPFNIKINLKELSNVSKISHYDNILISYEVETNE